MKNSVFATAALVAAAAADNVGSAIVVNKCNYDVTLVNVPSSDGGYSEIDKTLSPYDTYTQAWTSLSNGNGWSIKLSNSTSLENILQYEYTYQNDGTIWYDLSEVNGNPGMATGRSLPTPLRALPSSKLTATLPMMPTACRLAPLTPPSL
ncbi:unnamed protein product [Aureobasidium pullulans]|nr:unnamed protein product [Aureobasidium pullulans]